MTRDVNGLQNALRKNRANTRLIVDTVTGVILGYPDTGTRNGEVRSAVCEAIAHRGVVILTIDEYLRMTMEDDERRQKSKDIVTAGDWYREMQEDGRLESMLASKEQINKFQNTKQL